MLRYTYIACLFDQQHVLQGYDTVLTVN